MQTSYFYFIVHLRALHYHSQTPLELINKKDSFFLFTCYNNIVLSPLSFARTTAMCYSLIFLHGIDDVEETTTTVMNESVNVPR